MKLFLLSIIACGLAQGSAIGPFGQSSARFGQTAKATPRKFYKLSESQCSAQGPDGPIIPGGSTLPENLQGVWWLTLQGSASALMSFAANGDATNEKNGYLKANGKYNVRVAGDRNWALHTEGPAIGASNIDLEYKFQFDNATNPTFAQIDPFSLRAGAGLTGPLGHFLMSFTMKYKPEGTPQFPGSKVWKRRSTVFGIKVPAERANYELVQVMDGRGKKIQPAFDAWLSYCNNPKETGSTPGKMFYHEIRNATSFA